MGRSRYIARLLGELFQLARERKAYWLVPTIVVLLLIGFLVVVSEAAAPFIYTIF
jgi:hypothetical protein